MLKRLLRLDPSLAIVAFIKGVRSDQSPCNYVKTENVLPNLNQTDLVFKICMQ